LIRASMSGCNIWDWAYQLTEGGMRRRRFLWANDTGTQLVLHCVVVPV